MIIEVNGEKKDLQVQTLIEVVEHFDLQDKMIVTEVEGKIIDRDQWDVTEVQPGMKIELVHFVGGG
ncbi:sulfur carrier protein ThiS [Thalassorhabdus alkalitolerans]|uniref:Sulfur carrier protein ThiS n=1 Tax=Thalassorhabdus alkalitolerans TaxID=2282697 RepID=A0ABW0YPT9_9BACI|nr:sulfur carrier protein ThiS [Thalassobacillus sp. C254]